MTDLNNQLQSALDSGNYSLMAKAAKMADIFQGQAPKKADLKAKIQAYLDANVTLGSDDDDTDTVSPSAGVVDNTPKATGYIGGQAEFYYWPEFNVYAQNVSGQAIEPKFDPAMWETMKTVLPKAEALKTNVVKAATKAAEAIKYTYTVTVNFTGITFESTDPELAASELSAGTLIQLLDGIICHSDTNVTFNVVRGKVKKTGSRGTSGQGSGFYTATQRSELKELNVVQKQVLQAAASIDGCPLSDYAKYGRQDSVKLGNICIEFKKKGYGDAIRRQNGAIFFDPGAMYDGYTLADSGI